MAGVCERCGRPGEAHRSDAHGQVLCLGCHLRPATPATDPATIAAELEVAPCPACGEPLGARYAGLCWPCWSKRHPAPKPQPPADPVAVAFRRRIFAALDRVDADRFAYGDVDRFTHVCPVCQAGLPEYLLVRFHGRAPRADLVCSLGCEVTEIAKAIKRLGSGTNA